MGSVSNSNSNSGFSVADLLQTVTGANSPESSAALSTPAVQAALQNASPGDTVALSDQAVKLQEATQLFAISRVVEGATLSSMLYPLASAFYPLSDLLSTLNTASPPPPEPGSSSSTESIANG
jgi:hypothetical protein